MGGGVSERDGEWGGGVTYYREVVSVGAAGVETRIVSRLAVPRPVQVIGHYVDVVQIPGTPQTGRHQAGTLTPPNKTSAGNVTTPHKTSRGNVTTQNKTSAGNVTTPHKTP